MIIKIIIIGILLLLIYKLLRNNKEYYLPQAKDNTIDNKIKNNSINHKIDNYDNTNKIEYYDNNKKIVNDYEDEYNKRKKIDKYRERFFSFNDIINNSSHKPIDAVDKINHFRDYNHQNIDIGDIYDQLIGQ